MAANGVTADNGEGMFLFTSESVGEGHPGKFYAIFFREPPATVSCSEPRPPYITPISELRGRNSFRS